MRWLVAVSQERGDVMNSEIGDQASEVFHHTPDRWPVAKEGVSPSVAQEYVAYSTRLDYSRYSEGDVEKRSQSLFNPDTPGEEKKEALVILAHRGAVKSYRTLERFLETAEGELEEWGILALEECRGFLEGSLLDRDVGVVMTGLGGEGERLRYFFLVRSKDDVALTDFQKEAVKRAFSTICGRYDSLLEVIEVKRDHVMAKVLVPMDVAVGKVVEGGIEESNTFGGFLDPDYYVTNVEIPSEVEVLGYLRMRGEAVE
jgi:hypothetical protein